MLQENMKPEQKSIFNLKKGEMGKGQEGTWRFLFPVHSLTASCQETKELTKSSSNLYLAQIIKKELWQVQITQSTMSPLPPVSWDHCQR